MSDRIHCLVSVIPANKISLMDDAVINKMKEVRATAESLSEWKWVQVFRLHRQIFAVQFAASLLCVFQLFCLFIYIN